MSSSQFRNQGSSRTHSRVGFASSRLTTVIGVALATVLLFGGIAGAAAQQMCCNQTLWNLQELNTGTGVLLRAQGDGDTAR